MSRVIDAFTQFFDDNGDPLVDGFLKFNESGTNNTDKDTFKDINETLLNENPVPLDGAGRCPNVFGSGAYNVISYTSDMQQIQQFDPVSGDPASGALTDWNASTIYAIGDIVVGSDGLYYRSITNNNQNNDPISSPAQWEEVQLARVWNPNVVYAIGDNAYGPNGLLYVSRTDGNINNNPTTEANHWRPGADNRFVKGANLDDTDIDVSNILTLGSDGNQFGFVGVEDVAGIAAASIGTTVKLTMESVRRFINSANLILPGGIDITTVIGDEWELFEYESGKWKALNIFSPNAPYKASVRQTVLTGVVDDQGFPKMISPGAGLTCDIQATEVPVVIGAAKGFGSYGDLDATEIIAADLASAWSALFSNSINFLYRDLTGAYGQVVNLPPVYGPTYVKAGGVGRSYLDMDGADAATAITDHNPDLSWTFTNQAQLDDAQAKFGATSLLLDASGDDIRPTPFAFHAGENEGGYEISCWFRLASVGINRSLWGQTSNFHHIVGIKSTNVLRLFLGSGSSWSIANEVLGTTTLVADTWYRARHVWDGATYKVYLSDNGAAETEEISVTSAVAFAATQEEFQLGGSGGSATFNGWIDDFSYAVGPQTVGTETPAATARGGLAKDTEHWFDTTRMVMAYWDQATAAWVDVQRVFMGEAITGASSVTSAITYALQGKTYLSAQSITLGTDTAISDNIGCINKRVRWLAHYFKNSNDFLPGVRIDVHPTATSTASTSDMGGTMYTLTSTTMGYHLGSNGLLYIDENGGQGTLTNNWYLDMIIERDW